MQLLALLPDSMWILVIVGLGIAVILQIVSIKTAVSVIAMFALMALLSPIIGGLLSCLPFWMILLLLIVFAMSTINLVMNGIFGHRTSSHFWAMLLYDLVKLPFRFIGGIFRRR